MQRGRFSLGTERDSILTTPAYASERKIHVPWRHGPLTALSASVKQATIRLMPKSVGIEHKAQDDTSLLVSLSLCVSALRNGTTPLVCRVGLRFGLAPQGKSPAEVHAALSRRRSRQGLQAPTLKCLRGALRGATYRRTCEEMHGRKRKLTRNAVLKLNATWIGLIKKATRQCEGRLGGHSQSRS